MILIGIAAAVLMSVFAAASFAEDRTVIDCPTCGSTTAVKLDSSTTTATCTEDYHWDYLCDTCGQTIVLKHADALGHNWKETVVEPGCETDGYTTRTCLRTGCGATETVNPVKAAGHTWVEVTIRPAKCETSGEIETKCSSCGRSQGITYPPATGHDWHFCGKRATCTEGGTDQEICYNCYRTTQKTSTAPLGHAFDEGIVSKAAGCEEKGVRTVHCTRDGCDETQTEDVDPVGHALTAVDEVPASEEAEGTLAHWKCTRCGKLFSDAAGTRTTDADELRIPRKEHVHSFTEEKTEATCTEGGFTTETCRGCGIVQKSEQTDPLGHTLKRVPEVPATEESEGRKEHWECTRCGLLFADAEGTAVVREGELVLPRAEHAHTFEEEKAGPSCTEEGYTLRTCQVCGAEERTDLLPALGHALRKIPQKPATEESEGRKGHWECTRCGKLFLADDAEREVEEGELLLPKLEHEHTWTEKVTEPGCSEPGWTEHTCTKCGETLKDNAAQPLGHDLAEVAEKEPTEEEPGVRRHWKCARCGKMFLDSAGSREADEDDLRLPPRPHEHVFTATVIPPTCTDQGYTLHTCVCGEETKDAYTDTIPHVLEKVEEKPPTAAEDGRQEHWQCTVCGTLFADPDGTADVSEEDLRIPAVQHEHSYRDKVTAPTCEEGGYTEHVCSGCGDSFRDQQTDPAGHALAYVPRKEPAASQAGTREHWKCTLCGKLFLDSDGTAEVSGSDLALPATGEPAGSGSSAATDDTEAALPYILLCIGAGSAAAFAGAWRIRRRKA